MIKIYKGERIEYRTSELSIFELRISCKEVTMNCELCGKNSELYETIIEGTKLDVCKECSVFGSVISKKKCEEERTKAPLPYKTREYFEEKEIVVNNYADIVKTAREKKRMTQEELAKAIAEKGSVIHKIESGQIVPQMKTAKKLEQFLRVKLITEYSGESVGGIKLNFSDDTMTIGDLLKIKGKGMDD